ncbi:9420_t:CDS:1, partial [Racocetra persica]
MHKSPLDNPSSTGSASSQERQRRPLISGPQTNVHQPVGMQQTNVPIQAIRPNIQQASNTQQNTLQQ